MNRRYGIFFLAISAIFAPGAMFADNVDETDEVLISYQASKSGKISAMYGADEIEVLDEESLVYLPANLLMLPQDIVDDLKAGAEVDYVIVLNVEKTASKTIRALRCHSQGGTFHCHRRR